MRGWFLREGAKQTPTALGQAAVLRGGGKTNTDRIGSGCGIEEMDNANTDHVGSSCSIDGEVECLPPLPSQFLTTSNNITYAHERNAAIITASMSDAPLLDAEEL